MATFEALAVVTNSGKARMAELIASGKSFMVDRFVVGDQGHDETDNTIALTPDPARTGCYCAPESITVSGGCLFEGLISNTTFTSTTCPVFQVVLAKGQATGVISSVCLLGTVVYSPTANARKNSSERWPRSKHVSRRQNGRRRRRAVSSKRSR